MGIMIYSLLGGYREGRVKETVDDINPALHGIRNRP